MSITLAPIIQRFQQIIGAPVRMDFNEVQSITNMARATTHQFTTTITEILDTTRRFTEEQSGGYVESLKGSRACLNYVTIVSGTLLVCDAAQVSIATGGFQQEVSPLQQKHLIGAAVLFTVLQVMKQVLYPSHEAEDRITLTRLWTQLDGVAPQNFTAAAVTLENQFNQIRRI